MSKEVQELFNSIAKKYDFLNHFMSFSIDRRWREKALSPLKGSPQQRILDLCAGTLDLTEKAMELFPEVKVTALDFSQEMLNQGKEKLKDPAKVKIVCADGHHLPFPNANFEAVICAFGIRNLENRRQAAEEIRRVLAPEGQLIILEFFRPENFFAKLFYRTYGKIIIPKLGGLVSKNRKAYEYLQNSIQTFLSVEEYAELLRKLDFKKITATPFSGGIVHQITAEV